MAFRCETEYTEYKKLIKNVLLNEKKMKLDDIIKVFNIIALIIIIYIIQEKPEAVNDPIMQIQNSIKTRFIILGETVVLRSKDGFGELSINQKQIM